MDKTDVERIADLIEEGALMVADLEAYKLENAKAHRQLLADQKIIARMERQVSMFRDALEDAETELRVCLSHQVKISEQPGIRAAVEAAIVKAQNALNA